MNAHLSLECRGAVHILGGSEARMADVLGEVFPLPRTAVLLSLSLLDLTFINQEKAAKWNPVRSFTAARLGCVRTSASGQMHQDVAALKGSGCRSTGNAHRDPVQPLDLLKSKSLGVLGSTQSNEPPNSDSMQKNFSRNIIVCIFHGRH